MKKALVFFVAFGLGGLLYWTRAPSSVERDPTEVSATVEDAAPAEAIPEATVEAKALPVAPPPIPMSKEEQETLSPQEREEQQNFQVNTAAVLEEREIIESLPYPYEEDVAAAEPVPLPE